MAPIRFYATSRGFGAFLAVWLIGLALLCAPSAQANPRYAGIVVDVESDVILYAENAQEPRYPASLTKMMTLYLLFEALEDQTLALDQTLPVSAHAAAQPASKLWVRPGERISVKKAILALIVTSANDVAVVVAEGLAASERAFAENMTEKAEALGMVDTTFRNASGLPDDAQVTTARDMAILSQRLMQDFPQFYGYFSRTRYTYRGEIHTGHNRLLANYAGADGLKTGYIRASGFNIATSAVRDDRRIITVVMGGYTSTSRDIHAVDLLDRGFARAEMLARGDWVAKTDMYTRTLNVAGAPVMEQPDSSLVGSSSSHEPASQQMPVSSAEASIEALGDDAAADPIQTLIARVESDQMQSGASWAVQVGAFHNRAGAQQYAHQAADFLSTGLGQPQVAVMPSDGERQLFRARLRGMQESQARRSCQQLMEQGMDCVVVRTDVGDVSHVSSR